MASLGSFSIDVMANVAKFESDLGKANRIAERRAKEMQETFEKAGKAIGIAMAAGATAIAALVKNSINSADELSKLSQKVGVSTEALSALKFQAGLAGVEIAGLQTGMVRFNKSIAEAAGGSKLQADTFKAMGISAKDAQGNLKGTEQLLGEVADKFAGYEDGAAKTTLAVNLFGRAGADMIVMLNGGSKAMADAAKEADELGQIIGTKTAKQAEEFNDNLSRAKMLATGFGNELAAKLLPALVGTTDQFIKGEKESGRFAQAAEGVAEALKFLAKGAIITKAVIEGLVNLIAASVDTIIGFVDIVNGAVTGIAHGIAGTMKQAVGDYGGAMEEFAQMNDSFAQGWDKGAKDIKNAWSSATAGIDDALKNAGDSLTALDKPLEDAAQRGKDFQNVVGGIGELAAKTNAPFVQMAGGADTASKSMKKLAEDIDKMQGKVADGQQGMRDLAGSLMEYADPLEEEFARFTEILRDVGREAEDQAAKIEELRGMTGNDGDAAQQMVELENAKTEAIDNATAAHERRADAILRENDITARYLEDLQAEARMIGLTNAQYRVESVVMRAVAEATAKNVTAGKQLVKVDEARIRQQAMINAQLRDLDSVLSQLGQKSPFEKMADDLKLVQAAMEGAFGPVSVERMEELERATGELRQQQVLYATDAIGQGITALQSMATEGSKAYKALAVAQAANNLVAAIGAVLNQGNGDPYTAFARMAAMAAAVGALVGSIGAFGGGGGPSSSSSEVRQANQGTGTILGDSQAKSESIANAVEITANATSELVGINRSMLTALESLQEALGAAGGMLARGAGNVDFGPAGGSGLFLGLFGDSRTIIDEGIVIAGGALNDMLNEVVVGAYQTIHSNGGLFGSSSDSDRTTDISDEFGRQFGLIMGSIADTVREGAIALGIVPAEIEAALAAYRIEEIRISLEDLSIEEQQDELAAVFSSIFDGLAGDVVPFIEQFQQVGEGLGETLVRVATGVQVMHEAISQLGFSLDETDPERFAQYSEALIGAVGSLDEFISGMQTFVSTFSSDAQQFQIATDAINSAFGQAGLAVPATADAFGALMQTLDATTEQGREQIATLIRLSSAAKDYYKTLEEFQKLPGQLMEELGQSGGFSAIRGEIESWERDTIASLNALGRAMGQAGAAEQDLVNVHSVAAQRIAQLIAKLKAEMRDLAVTLGYTTQGDTLESLNSQIDALGSASYDAADAISSAIDAMREKMNLLLGDLSPFNDQQKLELALQGLREGTVDPEQVLEIGRRLFASTSQYTDLFNQVMGMAQFGQGGGGGSQSDAEGRTLEELIAARDALLAATRPDIADDLAHRIAEIAYATGEDFAAIAAEQGFSLEQLGADLGIQGEELNAYLEQLRAQFEAQDFGTVTDAIRESADRIVEAITGKPIEAAIQMSDDRMAEIAADQKNDRAESDQATIDAINGLTSAVIASGAVNADRVVEVLDLTRRDLREANNRSIANQTRGREPRVLVP